MKIPGNKKNFLKDYGNIFLYIITIFFIILIFSSINSYFFKEIYKSSIFYFRFFAFIFFSSYLIIKFPKIVRDKTVLSNVLVVSPPIKFNLKN